MTPGKERADHGPVTHYLSEDGRSLIIEEFRLDAVYKTSIDWGSRKDCMDNWQQALQSYHDRRIGDSVQQPGQRQRTRRIGHGWYVTVLGGPPTWWWPRMHMSWSRHKVMVGWLRRGFVLAWTPPKETP